MNQHLKKSAKLLKRLDRIEATRRAIQSELSGVARCYDDETGTRGTSSEGLRRLCKIGGLL
jgi:hypothetical protein